jgi:1-acyl-sn-glycerol-3-phosphate acyltransferase
MPPAAVRRPVTVTVATSPLLLALAALVTSVTGRPQVLIFTRLAIVYFALEFTVLIACGALWLAACGGLLIRTPLFQRLHMILLRKFVHAFTVRWISLLEIEIDDEQSSAGSRALTADGPLLFFSRHAGPGDTILLIDALLTRYARLPSVVLKQSVAIDPCVDLIAHRLPHAVLDTTDPEACEARIEMVAAGLGERGVLLLFPGQHREAARAAHMKHVMAPRPGGALAALRGNPGAEVVFGAHSGLGLGAFPRQVWDQSPLCRRFTSVQWLVPVSERPADPDDQIVWLYNWWKRLDDWVETQGGESDPTGDRV